MHTYTKKPGTESTVGVVDKFVDKAIGLYSRFSPVDSISLT
jgi:hypothetical protein